ncbi:MAG: hypothetical protein Kow00104_18800 [Rhodothalassiaceae bacterium]
MSRNGSVGRRLRRLLLLLPVILVLWLLALFAQRAGLSRDLVATSLDDCRMLSGFLGPEDIAPDPERGIAYVTRADRFGVTEGGLSPEGGIDLISLTDPEVPPRSLRPLLPSGFFPHGLDLWIGPDGERRLFVVNHGASGHQHSVEIFAIDAGNALHHVETVRSDLFIDPNDIAATGPRSFYLTNLYGSRSAFGRLLESYLMLPRADVLLFDGRRARRVVEGLVMANGIVFDKATARVHVAEVIGRRVLSFESLPGGTLEKIGAIDLPMGPDNLTLDAEGAIWAAGHPKLLAISARMRDADRLSPSEVIRIDPRTGEWKTVWLDDGRMLGAASVALRWNDRLFIGAVFGDRVLSCRLGPSAQES